MSEKVRKKTGFFKSFVNVRRWVFYDEIVDNSKTIIKLGKKALLLEKKPKTVETFAEAIKRLQLTQEDLLRREKFFFEFSIWYIVIGSLLLLYAFYLLFVAKAFIVATVVIVLASLSFVYAYREHFWYMQMHERKLGCNFQDWLKFIMKKGGV